MRKMLAMAAVAAAVLVFTGSASAQGKKGKFGGFGGGGALGLLMNKDVQKDLKMTDDQIAKVKELSDKQGEAFKEIFAIKDKDERGQKFKEMAETNKKAVDDLLQPEQTKRVAQLQIQQQGAGALLNNAKVSEKLDLSQDQKEKIMEVFKEAGPKFKELFKGFFQASKEEKEATQKQMAELQKGLLDDALKVLNDDQKKAFNELRGEPFKGTLPPAFGGFGGMGMGMGMGATETAMQLEARRAPRRADVAVST